MSQKLPDCHQCNKYVEKPQKNVRLKELVLGEGLDGFLSLELLYPI